MNLFRNFVKETVQACKSDAFNQYKCDTYKTMILWVVMLSVFTEVSYWLTDCQICNGISYNTLIPRLSPVFFALLFCGIYKTHKRYNAIITTAYLVLHSCMWATIWSITYLPDKSHAREGFIVMHLMFIAMGYIAPYRQSIVWHTWLIADIIISNSFHHYEHYDIMISMSVIAMLAIEIMVFFTNNGLYDRYQIKQKLEWLSYHDQLTGLYNRNVFKDESLFSRRELDMNSWILVFDIDFFKRVNDTYGHLEGDNVLKSISSILLESVGSYDGIAMRWGGEEFMIIEKHATREAILSLAENIRKRVSAIDDMCCPVTISCGAAMYKSDFKSTVRRADEALYNAKASGRNCVKLDGED